MVKDLSGKDAALLVVFVVAVLVSVVALTAKYMRGC